MPLTSDIGVTPKKDLHVIYVLDTSGSMEGIPIQMLNQAMQETIVVLKKVAKREADAQLKISVLEFSTGIRWMNESGPVDVEDFIWMDLSAGGLTNVGGALKELNSKLTVEKYLKSEYGAMLPIIIFMTDGYATDEYKKELERIKTNSLFRKATRIGFAIGDNPDVDMITRLAGDSEAVVHTDNLALFARLLRFASVTASTLAGTSQVSGAIISNGRNVVSGALRETGISRDEIDPGIEYREEETVNLEREDDQFSTTDITWDDDGEVW